YLHYLSSPSFLILPHSPTSTLFPYTTLFRSLVHRIVVRHEHAAAVLQLPDRVGHGGAVVLRDQHAIAAAGHFTAGVVDRRNGVLDRKSTRLNSSHSQISYAVFCLKKKKKK